MNEGIFKMGFLNDKKSHENGENKTLSHNQKASEKTESGHDYGFR
jgi:hypothetical protein